MGLAVLGTAMGSFGCCQAWRLRLKEKREPDPGKRSVCLKCKKRLRWYDNIPLVSWIRLRGKCRYCKENIGGMELLAEAAMAGLFVALGELFWPGGDWVMLALTLALSVALLVLLIYDAKWGRLPVKVLVLAVLIGAFMALWGVFQSGNMLGQVIDVLSGVAVLAGLYFMLYFYSRERLVGSGDWILSLAIALALSSFWLALLELFLANFLGSIAGLMMMKGKKKGERRGIKVHFGPYLIIAFWVIYLLAEPLSRLIA